MNTTPHHEQTGAVSGTPNVTGRPSPDQAQDVIKFWRDVGKGGWFVKNETVDRRFRELFYDLHFAAARCQ